MSEITRQMTARLKRGADLAANLSRVEKDILPQMEKKIHVIVNAVSGLERLNDLVKEIQQEYEEITHIVADANAAVGTGVYHAKEAFDAASELESSLADDATLMQNFPVWFQANPGILKYALEMATGFSRKQALIQMKADDLKGWQQAVNEAIKSKGG